MIRALLVALALVLAAPAWAVNPSLLGGATQNHSSSNRCSSPLNIGHQIFANTDLLVVLVAIEGNESITSIDWNCTSGCEGLTLQVDSGVTGSNSDIRVQIWTLLSPTVATDDIDITCGSQSNPTMFYFLNWDNVDTTPGEEVNEFQSTNNTSETTTCVMSASQGASGNTLISIAAWQGANAQPFTETAGWNAVFADRSVGTNNAGMSSNVFRESTPPNTLTTTATGGGATDENACAMLELCAVGECGAPAGRTRRYL